MSKYLQGNFYLIVHFNESTSVEPLEVLDKSGKYAMFDFCKEWDLDPTEENKKDLHTALYVGDKDNSPHYLEKDNYVMVWADEREDDWCYVSLYRKGRKPL